MVLEMINIGVDIEDIERFSKLDVKKNKNFFKKIYTEKEIEYCLLKANPYPHFAVRFAGKEAVIKVLSAFGEKICPHEIEILNNKNGVPYVNLKNEKLKIYKFCISLSHCKDKAIAFSLGLKNGGN